jgi:acyl-CoA synthetase (NDP forming)
MTDDKEKSLDLLFSPKSVVIFQAKAQFSYFITGFQTQGFNTENLYLISPTEDEILGIKCYKSIDDLPIDVIDYLILAVRREKLIQTLNEFLDKKKVHFIHFFTAGTGEFDEVGGEIEKQLYEILNNKEIKTRAIGPNCMGVYSTKGHTAYLPVFPNISGNIGLIYHSGDLTSKTITYGFSRYKLTFSKCASIGNCVDLQVSDFLKYFNQDEETEVICVYFEGFNKYHKSEGRELLDTLKKMRKPVLFLRGGKSKRGQSAVLTHTGSLGTDDKIWQAIYKQTGVIEVTSDLDEVIDYLYIFNDFFKKNHGLPFEKQMDLYPKGKNALVILWSGGLGILDTDILIENGINMPLFDDEIKDKLMDIYPLKVGSLSNPLDMPWMGNSEKYLEICLAAIAENIDLVIMHTDSGPKRDDERFKKRYNNLLKIKEHCAAQNKIFILILPEYPNKSRARYFWQLIEDGFIVYPSIQKVAKAFLAIHDYGKRLKQLK